MDIIYTDTMTGEEYNEIRKSVDWEALTRNQAERGIRNTTFLVAARVKGKIVGMGRVLFDFGYTAYIGDVIVSPEYQGRGIGKAIVSTLIQKVKDAADEGDHVMFILGAAKGKEGFYQKIGFETRPSDSPGMIKWVKV